MIWEKEDCFVSEKDAIVASLQFAHLSSSMNVTESFDYSEERQIIQNTISYLRVYEFNINSGYNRLKLTFSKFD